MTDSAVPPQSATVSLGRVPAGNAVSFTALAGSDARQVAFSGGWLIVNDTDRVVLLDVTVPASPVVKATWTANHGVIRDLSVSGNLVAVRDDNATFLQVGVDGSGNPALTQVSALPNGNTGTGMQIVLSGQWAYLTRESYVWPIDVSDPTAPKVFGYINNGATNITDVAVWQNYLIESGASGSYPIMVARLNDPSVPVFDGGLWPGNLGDGHGADFLRVSGDKLYVSRGTYGMGVVNLAASPKPAWMTTPVGLPGTCQGMSKVGTELYAAAGYGTGMNVVEVSDPASPRLVVSNAVQGSPHDVAVTNGYAYIATGGGIWTVELANQ